MFKPIFSLFCLLFSLKILAFPCYITLVKSDCWADYDVTVTFFDPAHDQQLTAITIAQGDSWSRANFNCQPKQEISAKAQFSPAIWEQDKDKVYSGTHDWFLPETINKTEVAWNLPVCFPNDFSQLPLPPTASGNCSCNMKQVTPLKISK